MKWQQVTVTMPSKNRVVQAEAKKRLAQKIDEFQRKGTRKSISNSTVGEVFKEWQSIRKKELKGSSYFNETQLLKRFMEKFGATDIQNIKSGELQNFFSAQPYVPQGMASLKCKIDIFFRFAVKRGYLEVNPMKAVVLPKRKLSEERLQQDKKKYLTYDEMIAVIEVVKNPRWLLFFEFLFLTGLRIGELLALRFEDYDDETKEIHVRHTLNCSGKSANARVLQTPKTELSSRPVSLDDRCLEIIDYFDKSNADPQFIFTSQEGHTPSPSCLRRALKNACMKALGLTWEQTPTLHGLRHSHISFLAELGIPMKACMERVGHADEKMILRIYAHVTPKMKNELIQKINQKLTKAGAL